MAQDLRLLDSWVAEGAWPHVACPTCVDGYLAVESIKKVLSLESERLRDHEAWEPDWISGTFHGTLKCALPKCGEHVVVSGLYKVGPDLGPKGHWYGQYEDFLRLRFAEPPLLLMSAPPETPEKVTTAVSAASAVLWADPGAAANRLRWGIEELLTAQGMRRYVVKNHKRTRLSTHQRIQEFKKYAGLAADALEAVKWIGNSGSHDDQLTASDVLDGADLLRHALVLLYDRESERVERQIKAINKARGIPKASQKKRK